MATTPALRCMLVLIIVFFGRFTHFTDTVINPNVIPRVSNADPPSTISDIVRHGYVLTTLLHKRPARGSCTFTGSYTFSACFILLLAGDVEANPGPVKYPCGMCRRPAKPLNNQTKQFVVTIVTSGSITAAAVFHRTYMKL